MSNLIYDDNVNFITVDGVPLEVWYKLQNYINDPTKQYYKISSVLVGGVDITPIIEECLWIAINRELNKINEKT